MSNEKMDEEPDTRLEMVQETSRISWAELERHFARGVVIHVDSSLDLVQVAANFVDDNKTEVERLLKDKSIEHLTVEMAKEWSSNEPELWAVVTAPWVLVQDRK